MKLHHIFSPLRNTFRRYCAPALLLAAGVALQGCDDKDDDGEHRQATLYDIVELTSTDAAGSTFTLWRPDADEAVTLRASGRVSGVSAGDCLFLAYTPLNGKAYTSGDITIQAQGYVNNSALKKSTPEKLDGWDSEPVYLMSLWRAGDKVCMRLRMTYDEHARLFALVADETTLDEEYPTVYLFHRRINPDDNFARQYYAAFDVSALWSRPGCRGVRVRVNNSNNPALNTFTIENPSYTPVAGEN